MLKIGTVFSGIGAFEQALKKLNINHQILFACDNDKFVKQSYFANYDIDESRWYNNVFGLNGKKYQGKVDLFVGGSPCQSFSMIGFREGLKDKRGLLIFEFTRLINEIQPQCFIFENVKGLLTHNKGKTWECILKEFKSTGYYITHQLLNAKDYGMPQSRTRLFVVGFKEKNNFEFPKPIELEKKMNDFLEHVFANDQSISQKGKDYVLNEERMRKKITQINGGNQGIMLCQVRNQQSNFIGDFVSENFINSYNELDYIREREREREQNWNLGKFPTNI